MADTGITVANLKAQLSAVQTAITAILTTGQAYSRPGLSLTRVDWESLKQREQYLVRQLAREDTGAVSYSRVSSGETNGVNQETAWDAD